MIEHKVVRGWRKKRVGLALASMLAFAFALTSTASAEATEVVKGSAVAAAGIDQGIVLLTNGKVLQVGIGNNPIQVPAGLTDVISVAGLEQGYVALKSDGTVTQWGSNLDMDLNYPEDLSGVTAISAAYDSIMALKSDRTVVQWGRTYAYVPEGLSNVVAIAQGTFHHLALKSNGTVVGWAYSGSFSGADVPANLSQVTAIAAGSGFSLALKSNGTVVSWGSQTEVPADLSNVVKIAAGGGHSLALKSDGTVVAWGRNDTGESDVPEELSGVVAIAAGDYTSWALKNDGTLVQWGGLNPQHKIDIPGSTKLESLNVSGAVLSPQVNDDATAYTAYVNPAVTDVEVTVGLKTPESSNLIVGDQIHTSGQSLNVPLAGSSTSVAWKVEPYLLPNVADFTLDIVKDSTPPTIEFGTNGNPEAASWAASTVAVSDSESGADPSTLEYVWTPSPDSPAEDWNSFANGANVKLPDGAADGDWYLRVKGSDMAGNTAEAVSAAFLIDASSGGPGDPYEVDLGNAYFYLNAGNAYNAVYYFSKAYAAEGLVPDDQAAYDEASANLQAQAVAKLSAGQLSDGFADYELLGESEGAPEAIRQDALNVLNAGENLSLALWYWDSGNDYNVISYLGQLGSPHKDSSGVKALIEAAATRLHQSAIADIQSGEWQRGYSKYALLAVTSGVPTVIQEDSASSQAPSVNVGIAQWYLLHDNYYNANYYLELAISGGDVSSGTLALRDFAASHT
ncbi:RCC1 domain-containing protein [Cohnella lupini]|uniref:Alpha-tubulin suppressor-like RCC1 family protein n=1 Tax=Cohnella lupini TaxID=1294267 RepID=A0A3D9I1R7_9BACL|nr:hypothetical protein [Cohnella lupini]RED55707.1 alpha-tubulin suppressor-like RCC1 family protein [Cohnella lupini]